jgi:hypothetical protein
MLADGDGENTQKDFKSAANRACDNQHNACANLANNKSGKFTVGQCDQQSCKFRFPACLFSHLPRSLLLHGQRDRVY